MLSDDQIDVLADELIPIYQSLELDIINDIARRVQTSLMESGTVMLEIKALERQGYSAVRIRSAIMKKIRADKHMQRVIAKNTDEYRKDVKKFFASANKKSNKAIKRTLNRAIDESVSADKKDFEDAGQKFKATDNLKKIVDQMSVNAKGDLSNLTSTTAFSMMGSSVDVRDAYLNELNKALVKLSSGAFNIDRCVKDCVRGLAQSGLKSVEFQGKTMQVESAARLALRTTMARLSAETTMENAKASGQDLIEVSEHWGARTDGSGGHADHMAWQGKVYSISGENDSAVSAKLGYKIRGLEEATGYPSDLTGLCGYNCRHTMSVFFRSSTPNKHTKEPEPVEYNGKEYTYAEASSKMRVMERNIRNLKRERDALKELDIDIKENQAKIDEKTREYKEFCKAMNIQSKMNRCRYLD